MFFLIYGYYANALLRIVVCLYKNKRVKPWNLRAVIIFEYNYENNNDLLERQYDLCQVFVKIFYFFVRIRYHRHRK